MGNAGLAILGFFSMLAGAIASLALSYLILVHINATAFMWQLWVVGIAATLVGGVLMGAGSN
ncbi:MAG TPA: hypothetical protein PLW50_00080 [Smithellaceae bacterium]|nr:hypothetical protein [Smithellaceae bacterium]